jgi:hypothetical protein
MTTESDLEGTQESGGALRDNLEKALAENRQLKDRLAAEAAAKFQYVKPEDLQDVAPDDLSERAAQLEAERKSQREEVLVAELKARGWSDERIAAELKGDPAPAAKPTPDPLTQVRNVGTPPARPAPGSEDGLFGADRIAAALGAT